MYIKYLLKMLLDIVMSSRPSLILGTVVIALSCVSMLGMVIISFQEFLISEADLRQLREEVEAALLEEIEREDVRTFLDEATRAD